jgi:hypothetical protein
MSRLPQLGSLNSYGMTLQIGATLRQPTILDIFFFFFFFFFLIFLLGRVFSQVQPN